MAVLSKIRERSILVISVIGLALFAFVLMDLLGNGGFNSTNYVGSVNGHDISTDEFRFKVSNEEQRNPGASALMVANNLWNQEIKNVLYKEQFELLGLRVGKNQVRGVIEKSGDASMLDENGKFSQQKFNDVLEMVKAQNPGQYQMWLNNYQSQLEDFAKEQIYSTLVKAGFNATNLEGKMAYQFDNDKASFDYVYVSYATVNDDQVKVTDQEIVDYMKKRQKQFKSEETRDVEYVLLSTKASDEDIKEIESKIKSVLDGNVVYNDKTATNDTLPGFAKVTNVEEFVNNNSDIPFSSKYYFAKNLGAINSSELQVGNVTSIYQEDNFMKVSRVLDSKFIADSVKASHIILPYVGSMRASQDVKDTKEIAKQKADSIFALVKNDSDKFKEIANQINSDGTKGQDGSIGWIMYSQITDESFDKDFSDFMFFNNKGDIKVVETKFGFHIIKIDDMGSKQNAYKLATVARQIEASQTTNDAMYSQSQAIALAAESKSLEEVAKEYNLVVTPAGSLELFTENIQGLGSQRPIVQWAFSEDTKKGDVRRFDVNEGFVVAKLKNINDNGLQSVEKARPFVEPIIKNTKKAEIIKAKMKGNTLEEVAKNAGVSVANATGVSLSNAMIPNVGPEPKVVGVAFGLKPNTTSGIVEGKTGVFMVKGISVVKAPELPNYLNYSNRIKAQAQNFAPSRILPTLKAEAKIKDNRKILGY